MRFALCLMAVPALAHAGTYATIATLPGSPMIGAVSGGMLYGTDASAGGNGTLFSLSTSGGGYTVLHSFTGRADGGTPNGQLAVTPGGLVAGTARQGGSTGDGALFGYMPGTGFAVLHSFGVGTDGADPLQGPVANRAGGLFGSTAAGAVNTNGMAWKLTSNGTYVVLHDFLSGSDGHCPFSGVAVADGATFGTTVGHAYGGNPNGSVWRIEGGTFTTLYVFGNGKDGEWPDEAPTADKHGNLFGTTHVHDNDRNWPGAVWTIPAGGSFAVLHDLNGTTDGAVPNAPLLLNTDGYLYGTTAGGGTGNGTLFRISKKGVFKVLHTFAGAGDGAAPSGALAHDAAGVVYGGTINGVVFSYTP